MTSNFAFFSENTDGYELFLIAQRAEKICGDDPTLATIAIRKATEKAVKWIFRVDDRLSLQVPKNFDGYLGVRTFQGLVGYSLLKKLDEIRKTGNRAAHSDEIPYSICTRMLRYLHEFLIWITNTYWSDKPVDVPPFDSNLLPKETVKNSRKDDLSVIASAFEELIPDPDPIRDAESFSQVLDRFEKKIPFDYEKKAREQLETIDLLLKQFEVKTISQKLKKTYNIRAKNRIPELLFEILEP